MRVTTKMREKEMWANICSKVMNIIINPFIHFISKWDLWWKDRFYLWQWKEIEQILLHRKKLLRGSYFQNAATRIWTEMLSHCFLRAACLPISPWRLRRDHTSLFTPDRQCYGTCLAEGVICEYNVQIKYKFGHLHLNQFYVGLWL